MKLEENVAWELASRWVRQGATGPGPFYDQKRVAMTLAPILAVPHGTILEVGSGSGEAIWCLKRMEGTGIAVGIDSDWRSLLHCVRAGNPASFARADADRGLPFRTGSVDCLLTSEVYEHLHHPAAFFQEAHRVLRPNGLLLLTTPNLESLVLITLRRLPRSWTQRIVLRGGPRQRSLHPEFFGVPVGEDGHSHQREGSTVREMEREATRSGFRQVRATTWGVPLATDRVLSRLPPPVWRFILNRFHTLGVGLRHILVVWVRLP